METTEAAIVPRLSVDDALEGWGDPTQRADVLADEVIKLRAALDARALVKNPFPSCKSDTQ